MQTLSPEKVGPDANLAPCQTHIGGGADNLKFITMRSLLHVLDRWYPWIMFADGIAVVALLTAWLFALTP